MFLYDSCLWNEFKRPICVYSSNTRSLELRLSFCFFLSLNIIHSLPSSTDCTTDHKLQSQDMERSECWWSIHGKQLNLCLLFVSSFLRLSCCATFLQIWFAPTNTLFKCLKLFKCVQSLTLPRKTHIKLVNEEYSDLGQFNCPGIEFDPLFTASGTVCIGSH